MIIGGDWNSRTGQLSENEVCGDSVVESQSNQCNDTDVEFIPRCSQDSVHNKSGCKLLSFCKENDLMILNGRVESDSEGRFTYLSRAGCSVIDYVVVSAAMSDTFELDMCVQEKN